MDQELLLAKNSINMITVLLVSLSLNQFSYMNVASMVPTYVEDHYPVVTSL